MRFFMIFLFCACFSYGQAVVSAPVLETVQTKSLMMQKLSKIAQKTFSAKNIAWLSRAATIAEQTYTTATSVSRFVRNSNRFFESFQSLNTLIKELDDTYGLLDKMGVSKEQQEMLSNTNDISRDILGQLDHLDILKESGYKMNDFETLSMLDGIADTIDRSRRKIKDMKEKAKKRERAIEDLQKERQYTRAESERVLREMEASGIGYQYYDGSSGGNPAWDDVKVNDEK